MLTTGDIYTTESVTSFFVKKISLISGSFTTTVIAGTGSEQYGPDGPLATTRGLLKPAGIWHDTISDVTYFADCTGNRIRSVNATGYLKTIAGNGQAWYSGDNEPATSAVVNLPWGIWFDSNRTLFFADSGNHCIRKITHSTMIISRYAGKAEVQGFAGDGGPPTSAELNTPFVLWVIPVTHIFILVTPSIVEFDASIVLLESQRWMSSLNLAFSLNRFYMSLTLPVPQ
jgi:hypothetical protein